MATKVNYQTIKYTFSSVFFEASGLRLEASEDLPEGSVLTINSDGKLAMADNDDVIVGVCRFPAAQGSQAVCEPKGVIENKETTLGLTPGSEVFAGDAGAVSGTGTEKVGVAITADKIFINV